jgi:hypothetical protein
MKDLLVLVADKNMKSVFENLLLRTKSFGVREISYDVFSHHHHDPGVLRNADKFLQPFVNFYRYALVVFDRHGCGQKNLTTLELRNEVQERLNNTVWRNRFGVIVLDPELEVWVWADSPHVSTVLGIEYNELKDILCSYAAENRDKPEHPKEILEIVLRRSHIPRSSSLYGKLARTVGFARCTDEEFRHLRNCMQTWFCNDA